MSQPRQCNQCGAEVPRDAWRHEICPACLLKDGLDAEHDLDVWEKTTELTSVSAQHDHLPIIQGYRILRSLGEGGMGAVYLAEQNEPVRRRVAIKVIKPGMDSAQVLARFESERQALALMSHPYIARVYDAGMTEQGRPYFSMEYFKGLPITDFCDRERLSTEERLRLFLQVCEGITHAHQRGIIHRDIKPSNVLVATEGDQSVPKLIDFGLAKAMGQRLVEQTFFTEIGQVIGTPAYMSPEQADLTDLDIDTRTDVYSLGVLLYELLSGELPFDPGEMCGLGFDEWRRRVREDTPAAPSSRISVAQERAGTIAQARRTDPGSLERSLRRDLDWITMKALEKERRRRYASSSELAADVQRYLDDHPVEAGPPSASYRLRKFVRRHRLGVGTATLILVLLTGTLVAVSVQARRIALERDRANREAETATQISEFLTGIFQLPDPREKASDATAKMILAQGAIRIRSELRDQPQIRAELMTTIGAVQRTIGLFAESTVLLREALKVWHEEVGQEHFKLAVTLHELAGVLQENGDPDDEVRALTKEALEILLRTVGTEHSETAGVMNNRANQLAADGETEKAREMFQQSMEIYERLDHPRLAWTQHDYALFLNSTGDHEEALDIFQRLLAMSEKYDDAFGIAMTSNNLGTVYQDMGDFESALPLFEKGIVFFDEALGPDHAYVAYSLWNVAKTHVTLGNPELGLPAIERCLAIRDQALPKGNPQTIEAVSKFADILALTGQYDRAIEQYRRLVSEEETSHAEDGAHIHVFNSMWSLASTELSHGSATAGESLLAKAVAIFEEIEGPDSSATAYNHACYRALLGDREGAIASLRRALDLGYDDVGLVEDPDLASLFEDPEFQAIAEAVRSIADHR